MNLNSGKNSARQRDKTGNLKSLMPCLKLLTLNANRKKRMNTSKILMSMMIIRFPKLIFFKLYRKILEWKWILINFSILINSFFNTQINNNNNNLNLITNFNLITNNNSNSLNLIAHLNNRNNIRFRKEINSNPNSMTPFIEWITLRMRIK